MLILLKRSMLYRIKIRILEKISVYYQLKRKWEFSWEKTTEITNFPKNNDCCFNFSKKLRLP